MAKIDWKFSECAKVDSELELDKRTYLPGILLTGECPKCGAKYERDLGYNYLSYPKTGVPEEITFCCNACDEEWVGARVTVNLSVDVEVPSQR